jgi:hypothetical protein
MNVQVTSKIKDRGQISWPVEACDEEGQLRPILERRTEATRAALCSNGSASTQRVWHSVKFVPDYSATIDG